MYFSKSCNFHDLNLKKHFSKIKLDDVCVSEVINLSKSEDELCFVIFGNKGEGGEKGNIVIRKNIAISNNYVTIDGSVICRLSGVESRVFEALLEHRGEVVSRDALHEIIYNKDRDPLCRRVDNLVSSIRKKIEENKFCPELIVTVRFKGYVIH